MWVQWFTGFGKIFMGTKDFMLRVKDLRKKLPALRANLSQTDYLTELWEWCFEFTKEDEVKKGIQQEDALPIMDMLLRDKFTLWASFRKFLLKDEKKAKAKRITKDEWKMTLNFLVQTAGDIEKFDPMGAWPLLIDDWVEWVEEVGKEEAGITGGAGGGASATVDLTA